MTPRAFLMDLPKELRLMIYQELLAVNSTGLQIACCSYHADIFKWEDDPASRNSQSHTRQTCNTLVKLLRTSREIYSEVTAFLYGAATFHFCIDFHCGQPESRATGPQLTGFGGVEFSCYADEHESFTKLAVWAQNIQVVKLHLELPTIHEENTLTVSLRLLLWESRDNLRATILHLNKSRYLKDLDLCCTVDRVEGIGDLPDVYINYIRPLQHLGSHVKLTILFACMDLPERLYEIEKSHRNFYHVQSLQDPARRTSLRRPKSLLLNKWLKIRIWCIRAFTLFHTELHPTVGDGNQSYEGANDYMAVSAGTALEHIWDAHDRNSHTEFETAKSELHEVWDQNFRIYNNLLDDLSRIEDVDQI
jgi:hypothetical protein